MALSAMSDDGKTVDWWFMYKVAGESTTTAGARGPTLDGRKLTGLEYLYFDASAPRTGKLALSSNTVQGGALQKTLNQIYGPTSRSVGWWFYNDENPIDDPVNGVRGHTKGVVAFDLSSNTAFWLIQSTPMFPPKDQYGFPKTGTANAQTFLCISLQNADVAQAIARQMYVAQQPSVYLASEIPAPLAGQPNDPRVKLMRDQVASGNTPVHMVLPFRSRGGVKFMSIARSRSWDLDFYNDLVGPTLNENLDVETWEHDPVPPPQDSDRQHTVVDMKAINLSALGIDLAWSEEHDHAKLAISARSERVRYVCVGDINYTIAQRKRGGGTVAFQCDALWASLSSIFEGVAAFPRTAAADKTSPGLRAAPSSKPAAQANGKQANGKQASDKQASGKQANGKQASDKQASDKQAGGKQASGKQASDKQASDKQASGKQASGKQADGGRSARGDRQVHGAGPSGPSNASSAARAAARAQLSRIRRPTPARRARS